MVVECNVVRGRIVTPLYWMQVPAATPVTTLERRLDMCVYSMIVDHYYDKWGNGTPFPTSIPSVPSVFPPPSPPQITPQEIEEFRKLLERAREYDKKHNEPDCELEEKKQRLLKLAEELGIKIDFL